MHDLSPCVTFSPTDNSYIGKYLASEDILNSNMTVESQIKLWGNGIFHSGRLVSLCYWAQQSKVAERVLDTQFHTISNNACILFLGHGVFISWSWSSKWLLHGHEKHHLHPHHNLQTYARSGINFSQFVVNIEVTDPAVMSWRVIAMFLFWHAWLQCLCWLWCCKSYQ